MFNEGRHFELAHCLGAQSLTIDGVNGVRFAVWAPNATRVAVVGDFNSWDRRRHPMRVRHGAGIWELFVPRVAPGSRYKYDILGPGGIHAPWKADPVARQTETPPSTASIVPQPDHHRWHDDAWMAARGKRQAPDAPIAIYEVHLGSWLKPDDSASEGSLWDFAIERLVPYLVDMGFTHVELLPITEHPFGGSWGYQPLGMFAPSGRFGPPAGLVAASSTRCMPPASASFSTGCRRISRTIRMASRVSTAPRSTSTSIRARDFISDWNTYIYNFGRREVQGFLIASALYWLEHFHIDGLRVDAVASMLYRDYSRQRRRVGSECLRRPRKSGGDRFPAPPQCGGLPSAVRARL